MNKINILFIFRRNIALVWSLCVWLECFLVYQYLSVNTLRGFLVITLILWTCCFIVTPYTNCHRNVLRPHFEKFNIKLFFLGSWSFWTCHWSTHYWGAILEDKLILDNRHSTIGVAQQWDQLNQLAMRIRNNLQQPIQARNHYGVAEDALKEFSMMFLHFHMASWISMQSSLASLPLELYTHPQLCHIRPPWYSLYPAHVAG